MKRISYRPFVFLGLLLLFFLSLPRPTTEKVRSTFIASMAPSWTGLHRAKIFFLSIFSFGQAQETSLELERLQQENQALRLQIETVREWLLSEEQLQVGLEQFKLLGKHDEGDLIWKEFFQRRQQEVARNLDLRIQSLPARVIFRDPASWSSSLWLNVGKRNNEALGRTVVAKNSPVLVGTSLVGIVELVEETKCRIRLITDSGLVPSVRAVRGGAQNNHLLEHLEALLLSLQLRDDLFGSKEETDACLQSLLLLKSHLSLSSSPFYGAKGEVYGSGSPLWRSRSQVLKGVGFNYDYSDEEGPARDLRTGAALDANSKADAAPLIRTGDLLVTTGLDAVFPAGLDVALVSKIERLREGAVAYELEAKATAGNLDELTHVLVLPPLDLY